MDRRAFLTRAGAAGATALAVPSLFTREAYADNTHTPPKSGSCCAPPSPNQALVSAATTACIIAAANSYAGVLKSEDWHNMSATHSAVAADLKAKGLDAQIIAAANSINATQIKPTMIPKNDVVAAVRVYQPSFSLTNVNAYMADIPFDSVHWAGALNRVRQYGLSPHFTWSAQRFAQMASYLSVPSNVSAARTAFTSNKNFVSLSAGTPQHPQAPPKHEGGGGGYTCADDAMANFAVSVAIGVVAAMAAPEVLGVIATSTALNYFLGWGGAATMVWGMGHSIVCNF